jgi:hypothetical protein
VNQKFRLVLMVSHSFSDGERFKVAGLRGVFVYRGLNPDGSVRCFGGVQGREKWRSFPLSAGIKPLRHKTLKNELRLSD